ncbi:MAG: hypothetical protein ABWX57_07745 [Aeromicrobium sp.]
MVTALTVVALMVGGLMHATPAVANDRIGPEFFGIDISISPSTPWPAFSPGGVRVATAWSSIERPDGTYNWSSLDSKVTIAEQHQARPLLVLEGTPRFHALGPAEPNYASAPDLRAYKRFVRALVSRYRARVDYQVWNEANVTNFFLGTPAQMARMTAVLGRAGRQLAPKATIAAPSFPLRGDPRYFKAWFKDYWTQRVQGRPVHRFFDVANLSAYPMPRERPEDGLELTQWVRTTVGRLGFKGPVWATEINYGASGLQPTVRKIGPGLQAAYVVRTYVLHAAEGADRVYWWRWENHQTVNTLLQDGAGNLSRAGRAYGLVREWLLGARPKGCSVTRNGLYTCVFKARDGMRRHVYWQRAGKVRTVVAPANAQTKTNTRGVSRPIKPGSRFRVGASPIMIEGQRSR